MGTGIQAEIQRAVTWLAGPSLEQKYQACLLIRIAAERDAVGSEDATVIPALVSALGLEPAVALVAIEAILCLISQPASLHRDVLRSTDDAHAMLIQLLEGGDATSDVTHRCLVILQTLGDNEADRRSLLSSGCGAAAALRRFLTADTAADLQELALGAICNIAAGSQTDKQVIAEAGMIAPLLAMLQPPLSRDSDRAGSAQLAALSLRNLSRNAACRLEMVKFGGDATLLAFLAEGLEDLRYPLAVTATFCVLKTQATMRQSSGEARDVAGIALFDIDEGHLLLVTGRPAGVACCGRPSAPTPDDLRDGSSLRVILVERSLKICSPSETRLELHLEVDGHGAHPIGSYKGAPRGSLLTTVAIDDCDAQTLSELCTRLLNKMYTLKVFEPEQRKSLAAVTPTILA